MYNQTPDAARIVDPSAACGNTAENSPNKSRVVQHIEKQRQDH